MGRSDLGEKNEERDSRSNIEARGSWVLGWRGWEESGAQVRWRLGQDEPEG